MEGAASAFFSAAMVEEDSSLYLFRARGGQEVTLQARCATGGSSCLSQGQANKEGNPIIAGVSVVAQRRFVRLFLIGGVLVPAETSERTRTRGVH